MAVINGQITIMLRDLGSPELADRYTRSRDALKAIRPGGWRFWVHSEGTCEAVKRKKTEDHEIVSQAANEELAELAAVIKAIEWEHREKPATKTPTPMNVFYVAMRKYESPAITLTAKQIKEIANLSCGNPLYQDKFGDGPDLPIGDGVAVNIAESIKHFYILLPATMYSGIS